MDRRRFLACIAAIGVMPKILLEPVLHRGGVVRSGQAFLVGETGPEIFINVSALDPKVAAEAVVKALRQWPNRDL